MAQNKDRNWQDRDPQQGGQGHRGGGQGGEDFGQGERGQHHGSEDHQGRGSWGEGRESHGGWQSGGQGQQGGEWSRMGRYGEEGWQGGQGGQGGQGWEGGQGGQGGHGGRMGRWGQGGNHRMDRDYGQFGSRGGSFGGSGYGRGASSSGGSYGQQQGDRGFWDRASDEVSSWFGDDEARRRRERDEHRGRGPKGYTRSDERIREDVNDRLTDDGWLDASDIEVQVSSAEVTLTGQVNSREEKRRAEDIVEDVSGVKHVQNNLRVKDRMSSAGQTSTTQFGSAGSSGSTSSKTGR